MAYRALERQRVAGDRQAITRTGALWTLRAWHLTRLPETGAGCRTAASTASRCTSRPACGARSGAASSVAEEGKKESPRMIKPGTVSPRLASQRGLAVQLRRGIFRDAFFGVWLSRRYTSACSTPRRAPRRKPARRTESSTCDRRARVQRDGRCGIALVGQPVPTPNQSATCLIVRHFRSGRDTAKRRPAHLALTEAATPVNLVRRASMCSGDRSTHPARGDQTRAADCRIARSGDHDYLERATGDEGQTLDHADDCVRTPLRRPDRAQRRWRHRDADSSADRGPSTALGVYGREISPRGD